MLKIIYVQPTQKVQLTLASDSPVVCFTQTFSQHLENVLYRLMLRKHYYNQTGMFSLSVLQMFPKDLHINNARRTFHKPKQAKN